MIKEALEFLTDRLTDNSKIIPVRLKEIETDPRDRAYWDPKASAVVNVTMDRQPVRHKLQSIESVIEYISNLEGVERTNVWVSDSDVTIEPNENQQTDLIVMQHRFAPIWQLLVDLRRQSSTPQYEAIRIIRQRFADFDPGSQALNAVRHLKLASSSESELNPTNARMGKSITAEASGAGSLPEFLNVEVPIYSTTGSQQLYKIRVWLAIDFENHNHIIFDPDSGDMDAALALERTAIGDVIKRGVSDGATQEVAVYYGSYATT